MPAYEYRVVPAPVQGRKAKGLKTSAERFAHALESLMNEMCAEGWDYVRADTLPCEERSGLTGRTTVYQNMLVFRRAVGVEEDEERPVLAGLLSPPQPEAAPAAPPVPPVPPVSEGRPAPGEPLVATRRAPLSAPNPAPISTPPAEDRAEGDAPAAAASQRFPDPSTAARAAAAALRTYRAGAPEGGGASDPQESKPSGKPGGPDLAAE
jgi:hypothetical protein